MQKKDIKKLDTLWSEAVKIRAGRKCEVCGKRDYLNSHHIFSRANRSVRWHLPNGCCLCTSHHTFSTAFSAHKAPAEFIEWIKGARGEEWYRELRLLAHSIGKPDFALVKMYLDVHMEEAKKSL